MAYKTTSYLKVWIRSFLILFLIASHQTLSDNVKKYKISGRGPKDATNDTLLAGNIFKEVKSKNNESTSDVKSDTIIEDSLPGGKNIASDYEEIARMKREDNNNETTETPLLQQQSQGEACILTEDKILESMEKYVLNKADENGNLNGAMWSDSERTTLPCQFKGIKKEGEPCKGHPTNTNEMCMTFSPETGTEKKLTHLFCQLNSNDTIDDGICVKQLLATVGNKSLLMEDIDQDHCIVSDTGGHKIMSDFAPELRGLQHYLDPCNPHADASIKERCATFVAIDVRHKEHSCVKKTHLYCDAVIKRCLCAIGQHENAFQYHKQQHICYIRPTFDFIEGYECANGSARRDITFGEHNYSHCACFGKNWYPPLFDSEDPTWWSCSAPIEYPILKVILLLFLMVGLLF